MRYQGIYAMVGALSMMALVGGGMALLRVKEKRFHDEPMFIVYSAPESTCGGMTLHTRWVSPNKPTPPPGGIRPLGLAPPPEVPDAPPLGLPIEADRPLEEWDDASPLDGPPGGTGPCPVPMACRKRFTPEDRLERLHAVGIDPRLDARVSEALRFLRSRQLANGSWPGPPVDTALVLLAHHGQGRGLLCEESGESILKATQWLMDQAAKPALSADDRAIVIWALAEVELFNHALRIHVPQLRERLTELARQWITEMGNETTPPPTRTSVWRLLALKSVKQAGIDAPGWTHAVGTGLETLEALGDPAPPDAYVGLRLYQVARPPSGSIRSASLPGAGPDSFLRSLGHVMAGDDVLETVAGPWLERLADGADETGGWPGTDRVATTAWAALTLEAPYRHLFPGQ